MCVWCEGTADSRPYATPNLTNHLVLLQREGEADVLRSGGEGGTDVGLLGLPQRLPVRIQRGEGDA